MQVIPLAADSMGVRSMATLVQAGGVRVLIDPGAALAAQRHGLPPSAEEHAALDGAHQRIIGALCQADAVVVTPYHDDHANLLQYVLSSAALYLKRPSTAGERRFARELFPRLTHTRRAFSEIDAATVTLRDLSLTFSPALPHGKPGARSGSVSAVALRCPEGRFVFASDVQGPLGSETLDWLIDQRPDLVYLSGAPTYRVSFSAEPDPQEWSTADVRTAQANLLKLMTATGCHVIVDHYLTRDPSYRRAYSEVFATGNAQTAAEFLGRPEQLLEAHRGRGGSQAPMFAPHPNPLAGSWDGRSIPAADSAASLPLATAV
ncbi:MAG: MBL fold metallo-hydrolase [Chloroflexota bacterium]